MVRRHWLDLMRITQTKIPLPDKTPDFTFGHIAALNLTSHSGVVEELIARAEAESRHEDAIGKVQSSWQKIEFSMLLFRDTEVPVLQFGSATEQLDGDLVALGQVLRSRYGHFHKKATEWQSTLTSLLGSMLLLDRVQRLWCLVQPLFETEEIRLELPSESKAFREADSSTRFLLTRMWKNKAVIKITKESGIGSKLVGIVESLETCKQSLWDFLDRKRMQFPRLYFVSDDVLLAMVSHSSQPAKVLHFIQRVFSGVAAVALDRDVTVGSSRPSALSWSSSCGQETILFEKVYIYICIYLPYLQHVT
jgi:dynein heavy chain